MSARVLDSCCGGRMFWFDKQNPEALFVDIRSFARREIWRNEAGDSRSFAVEPTLKADFRSLPLGDESFSLVVFDPPHLKRRHGKPGWINIHYGQLNPEWRDDLTRGFSECFRVLKPSGVLIFKWSEVEIPISQVVSLAPKAPLFGHRVGKVQGTHWVTFIK